MFRRKFPVLTIVWALVIVTAVTAAPAEEAAAKDALARAAWTFSSDGGKTFALRSLEIPAGATINVVARATFKVDDPAAVGGVRVMAGRLLTNAGFKLNGKQVTGPLPGMLYYAVPVDPRVYLTNGENVLIVTGSAKNRSSVPMDVQLRVYLELYPPAMVSVQTGPMLGVIGPDFFTLTCRTNMPAEVTVTAQPIEPAGGAKTSVTSPRGFYHRLRVPLAKGTRKFSYTVTCQVGTFKKTGELVRVGIPAFDGKSLRFVAAGDCRSHPDRWAAVAAAIHKARPELMVFSGDMVGDGRWDHTWDQEWSDPARALLASVPIYPVIGNHEHNAAAYFELFYTPSENPRNKKWAQAVGTVLFIGIDGAAEWSGDSPNGKWLEEVLKKSKEKFIFLATHYPAWSSGPHGKGNEGQMRAARKFIMPLLAKYNATAMIAGHDHDYERSEPPADQGVTCIVTGAAGAPTYGKSANNPYSKAFAAKLSFCVFDVNGDTCDMKVYEPSGRLIDERTFKARKALATAERSARRPPGAPDVIDN